MARKKKSSSKKKLGSHSIAAGEFENDAVSSGSTGTSRSLGWGTFTTDDDDAGGAGAGSAPGDMQTQARGVPLLGAVGGGDGATVASAATVPGDTTSKNVVPASSTSSDQNKDDASSAKKAAAAAGVAAAAAATTVASTSKTTSSKDIYFDAAQDMGDNQKVAAGAAPLPSTKEEEDGDNGDEADESKDQKPAATVNKATIPDDSAPVGRLAAADFFSGPRIEVNSNENDTSEEGNDDKDKKEDNNDEDDDDKEKKGSAAGALVGGAAVGAAVGAASTAEDADASESKKDEASSVAKDSGSTASSIAAAIPFFGKVLSSSQKSIGKDNSTGSNADENASRGSSSSSNNNDNTKVAGAGVAAGAGAAAAASGSGGGDDDEEESKQSETESLAKPAPKSGIAAAIPFLGNVLSSSKQNINQDDNDENASSSNNKTKDGADGTTASAAAATDEEGGATKSRDLEIPEKEATIKSRDIVIPEPMVASTQDAADRPAEDEEARKSRAAAAGGAGAAALVMSRGLPGLGDDQAGESSDTSSQHHNYLPADLGGAKGIVGDGSPPREVQGPVSPDEGAFDAASRDLKIVSVDKSRGGIGGGDVDDDLTDEERNRRRQNRIFALLACCWCCLILLAVLATLLAVYLGDDDDDEGPSRNIDPPDIPTFTFAPTVSPAASLVPTTLPPNPPLEPRLPMLVGDFSSQLFGSSLAFSSDGNVLAVGSLDGWTVYDSDGGDMTSWTPRSGSDSRLRKRHFLRRLQANNGGSLVGLSNNGNTVAVADLGGTRVRMYQWSSTFKSWTRVGNEVTDFTLTNNVESLAVSGSGLTIAVGGEGALQVFHYVPGGDRWFPRGPLLFPPGLSAEETSTVLGSKIALSVAGTRLVTPTSEEGELTVFEWNYGTNDWSPMGEPIPGLSGGPIDAICMSADGTVIAYGSLGVVRVYLYVDGVWVQLGSDMMGTDPSFGTALAMDGDASLLLVGANDSSAQLANAGEVRFYGYDGDEWVMIYETMYGAEALDRFGTSVSVSLDGRVMGISADQRDRPETGYVGLYIRDV